MSGEARRSREAHPCISRTVGADGVAVVTLDHPPVNAIHPDLLFSLSAHLRQAQEQKDVKAIVLTGANGRFSAGFDIGLFCGSQGIGPILEQRVALMQAFNQLVEAGPKPTVAAIERVALGGGLELAMACNCRLATPGTVLGLPESKLGILPGFGGTQRLPRLVGLAVAATMLMTGKTLKVHEAEEAGLIDEIVPSDELLPAARHAALELTAGRRPRRQTLILDGKLHPQQEALAAVVAARRLAARQHPGQHHYQLCLDALAAGLEEGPERGLAVEGEAFGEAASLPLHRALVRAFLAQKAANKVWIFGGASWPWLQLKALAALLVVLMIRLWAALATALLSARQRLKTE